MQDQTSRVRRSRWAAIGAAIAVSVGGGGAFIAGAASSLPSSVVTIDPVRVLDTRNPVDVGLPGPFVSPVSQKLKITGSVATTGGTAIVVPTGATGVLLNVTAVAPTAEGFISIRPGDATGAPKTSSLNFSPNETAPNSVQVAVPTTGTNAGQIDITFDALGVAGPTTDVLIDVVGYLVVGTGAAGPAGPAGPAGAVGPAGPVGPAGAGTLLYVEDGATDISEVALPYTTGSFSGFTAPEFYSAVLHSSANDLYNANVAVVLDANGNGTNDVDLAGAHIPNNPAAFGGDKVIEMDGLLLPSFFIDPNASAQWFELGNPATPYDELSVFKTDPLLANLNVVGVFALIGGSSSWTDFGVEVFTSAE